jgi:hypothetical protein
VVVFGVLATPFLSVAENAARMLTQGH